MGGTMDTDVQNPAANHQRAWEFEDDIQASIFKIQHPSSGDRMVG
jgi:hypothetical protein